VLEEALQVGGPSRYSLCSSKVFAFLHLGQFGEVLKLVRLGQEMAKKNENERWIAIFLVLEVWLRTFCFDFEGGLQLTKVIHGMKAENLPEAPRLVAMVCAGHAELALGKSEAALRYFEQVRNPGTLARVFLHWHWRMRAQLGMSDAFLQTGDVSRARREADCLLQSALSTADPYLQTLAWEMKTRVAMAEKDWASASKFIEQALAIVEKFGVPVAGWQVHSTAWRLYQHANENSKADMHRTRSKESILKIANSFANDDPLRATFLSGRPVAQILGAARANPPEWLT